MKRVREQDPRRGDIYNSYIEKIGELVHGRFKRLARGDIIIELAPEVEAILPRSQQSRAEHWSQGERIEAIISNVYQRRGPQVEVSRTSVELLRRFFQQEVPEIYDGTVVIKSAAREAGERSKIAVMSTAPAVNPVDSCVGQKGSRVYAITRKLHGERIDVIEWSDEPAVFAARSLTPAKVNQVRITDIENRLMEVIVSEDELHLAIGKKDQNIRLATELVGWRINVRSENET